MSTIITARFQQQSEALAAASALEAEGFLANQTTSFYVGTPGQHDLHPLGGDEMKSPGMETATGAGAVAATVGGSVGLITGLATLPILGPAAVVAGAGMGAWIGSLYGVLDGIKDDQADPKTTAASHVTAPIEPPRKSGMLVAVVADTDALQALACQVLRTYNGMDIGQVQGNVVAGDWIDFDPIAPVVPFNA